MVGILRCCGATLAPSPPQPRFGLVPAGQDPGQAVTPGTTTLPLGSQQNASPFCDHLVRAGSGTCRLGLITVWSPVRVLPAPPRSPALTPSSLSPRNTLDFPVLWGRLMVRSRSLRETKTVRKRIVAFRL